MKEEKEGVWVKEGIGVKSKGGKNRGERHPTEINYSGSTKFNPPLSFIELLTASHLTAFGRCLPILGFITILCLKFWVQYVH